MKKLNLLFAALLLSFSISFGQGYQIGDNVKDFSLKSVDGKTYSMASFPEAKGFIIVFTCNHCPYAKAYEDRIINLNTDYAPKGYPVIAINPNDATIEPEDSYENMQKRAKEKSYKFPYVMDETQEVAKAFGATRTPHVFLVQKNGANNTVEYIGAIDDNDRDAKLAKDKYVEKAIASLMNKQKPNPNTAKAIGCSIKWKKA